MAAYVILDIDVTDPDAYGEYAAVARPAVEAHGGRYLVRGGNPQSLEGDWAPRRIVVLEFDDEDAIRRWYGSPEYQAALPLRLAASSGRAVIVEGV